MKKRVISWLLCLALCLSMLPMAALAEDVQAPEGPAPSLNEPQPEPRAKENETPTPGAGEESTAGADDGRETAHAAGRGYTVYYLIHCNTKW